MSYHSTPDADDFVPALASGKAVITIEPRPLAPVPFNYPYVELLPGLVGSSEELRSMLRKLLQFAPFDADLILRGPTGVGKSMLARLIHEHSPCAGKPFVEVNCSAVCETLFEKEMFGHERGSFTGADARQMGYFEQAEGGTLFLDEIDSVPLAMQAKLLTAIESKTFRRIGGKPIKCDLRIIYATNAKLEALVAAKLFRQDLLARMGLVRIQIPSLRERRDDILQLFAYYLRQYELKYGCTRPFAVEIGALHCIHNYEWPNNVRELRELARLAVLSHREEGVISETTVRFVLAHGHPHTDGGVLSTEKISLHDLIPMPPYRRGEPFKNYTYRALLAAYTGLTTCFGDDEGKHQAAACDLKMHKRTLYHSLNIARKLLD